VSMTGLRGSEIWNDVPERLLGSAKAPWDGGVFPEYLRMIKIKLYNKVMKWKINKVIS